jgi:hypothetical protein
MSSLRPLLLGALALLVLAAVSLAVVIWRGETLLAYALPAALLLGAVALALLDRRARPRRVETVRRDHDRQRPGRQRDYCLRAHGYYRQLEALSETLPRPATRAALARDLPAAEAALRAVYDLCLRVQAYELGESQPPALHGAPKGKIARVTAQTDATIQATLDRLSERYNTLRRAWSEPAADDEAGIAPLDDLAPLTARLRAAAAAFAPASAEPVASREACQRDNVPGIIIAYGRAASPSPTMF